MCTCVCTDIYVCIYIDICVYNTIYIYIYTCIYTFVGATEYNPSDPKQKGLLVQLNLLPPLV